jgi:hypothetical protein
VSPGNFDFDSNGTNSAVPIAPAWVHGTAYRLLQEVTSDGGKPYVCITAGTSAVSPPGPAGTGSDITDGTVHWRYAQAWARWWSFIDMSTLVTAGTFSSPPTYGDGFNYGEGNLYGEGDGTPVALDAQATSDLVRMFDWKGAGTSHWGVGLIWQPGVFDPNATPTQHADGWWNLPGGGEWGQTIDVTTGLATRPPYIQWLMDRSQRDGEQRHGAEHRQ